MPSAEEILGGLSAISNSWKPLAVAWHAYFAVLTAGVALGWRPRRRLLGLLLVPPIVSVSVLAWAGGNPFNGAAFALAAVALISLLRRLEATGAQLAPAIPLALGTTLLAFAWLYPHFLERDRWLEYVYAAPLGVVPCPTLSAAIGVTMAFRGLGSRAWSLTLAAAGLFYGVFGSLRLGVAIDWALTAGAVCLVGFTAVDWARSSSARAESTGERRE